MNLLAPALQRVAQDLRAAEHGFALIGGLAVSARVVARFTRDVDLAVSVTDDADAERLVRTLLAARWIVHAAVEHEGTGRLATVRLVHRGADAHGAIVDLLFASSGIETEVVDEASVVQPVEVVPGVVIPVARTGHLLAMKVLSRSPERENDHPDIVRLCRSADRAERELAREAVRIIESRGYGRNRDLVSLLEEALRDFPFEGR